MEPVSANWFCVLAPPLLFTPPRDLEEPGPKSRHQEMKLGKLNAAIDAAPKVRGMTKFGPVNFEKSDLKRALKEHFTEGRNQKTGLCLNGDNVIAADPDPED